jgi:hypothetical protein
MGKPSVRVGLKRPRNAVPWCHALPQPHELAGSADRRWFAPAPQKVGHLKGKCPTCPTPRDAAVPSQVRYMRGIDRNSADTWVIPKPTRNLTKVRWHGRHRTLFLPAVILAGSAMGAIIGSLDSPGIMAASVRTVGLAGGARNGRFHRALFNCPLCDGPREGVSGAVLTSRCIP